MSMLPAVIFFPNLPVPAGFSPASKHRVLASAPALWQPPLPSEGSRRRRRGCLVAPPNATFAKLAQCVAFVGDFWELGGSG